MVTTPNAVIASCWEGGKERRGVVDRWGIYTTGGWKMLGASSQDRLGLREVRPHPIAAGVGCNFILVVRNSLLRLPCSVIPKHTGHSQHSISYRRDSAPNLELLLEQLVRPHINPLFSLQ